MGVYTWKLTKGPSIQLEGGGVAMFVFGKQFMLAKVGYRLYSDFCPHLDFLKILYGEKSKHFGTKTRFKNLYVCAF